MVEGVNIVDVLSKHGFTDVEYENNILTIFIDEYNIQGKEKELKKKVNTLKNIIKENNYRHSYGYKHPSRKLKKE